MNFRWQRWPHPGDAVGKESESGFTPADHDHASQIAERDRRHAEQGTEIEYGHDFAPPQRHAVNGYSGAWKSRQSGETKDVEDHPGIDRAAFASEPEGDE